MRVRLAFAGPLLAASSLLVNLAARADVEEPPRPRRDNPNGTNLSAMECRGFRRLPDLRFLGSGPYEIDGASSTWFEPWFRCTDAVDPWFMAHWVDCSYAKGTEVKWRSHTWQGRLGLADVPPGLKMTETARRWVSACLLASYNQRGRRQDTSLRGAHSSLWTTPGERWAVGHPEGVFFGDLFDKRHPGDKKALAMSLGLPTGWNGSWWPPGVVLGRTLDSPRRDEDGDDLGKYLGTCGANAASFRWQAGTPSETWSDEVSEAGDKYPPAFALGPHFANFEAADPSTGPSTSHPRWSIIDRAGKGVRKNSCPVDQCIGSYGPIAPGLTGDACHYEPKDTQGDPQDLRSATLLAGQEVEVVLRMLAGDDDAAAQEKYSAVIRYRRAGNMGPGIRLLRNPTLDPDLPGSWSAPAPLRWDPGGWSWLHVYPIVPTAKTSAGRPTLRFRLVATSNTQVELDAAGFVAGEPWCCTFPVTGRPQACQAPSGGVSCEAVQPPLRGP